MPKEEKQVKAEEKKELKEFHFPETGVTILAESREEAEKQLKK